MRNAKPRHTWADPTAYDEKARELAARFRENFEQFGRGARPEVAAVAPAAS